MQFYLNSLKTRVKITEYKIKIKIKIYRHSKMAAQATNPAMAQFS